MARDIAGMVVAITGASSGIGAALARQVVAGGGRVALMARRQDRLAALRAELGEACWIHAGDVAREDACQALVDGCVGRYGRVDAMVCNAGAAYLQPIAGMSAGMWHDTMQVNVMGTVACAVAAVAQMRAQSLCQGWRGQIMITSSCLARRALPGLGAYCASKAAQLAIAEALRVELRPERIAVTSVHPVGTASEFTASAEARSQRRRPPRSRFEVLQSSETVAASMLAALRQPIPEVWPHPAARWFMALATLAPGLVDRLLGRRLPT